MNAPKTLIEPPNGWLRVNFRELYEYRELIGILAWRDVMAQYKQAFFGIAWALARPLFSVLVYTLVFGKVAGLSSGGVPYPLFTLCGVAAWSFFSTSLAQSTVSLLGNRNLITKVYFPRLAVPLASLGRGTVDLLITLLLLAIVMACYGFAPSVKIFYLPLFLLTGLAITLGAGLFFSALSVKYHDLKHAIPFLTQTWFWVTPVAYGLENVPDGLRPFFLLNPMTWVVQGFRWSLLGVGGMDWAGIGTSALFALLVLLGGLFYFRRAESEFADVI